MSADTTIAVFRFNDGKCRVGLVQAIENFTGFQWGKSRFGDRERDAQMLGYRACRSLQVALSAATRIFLKDADIVPPPDVLKKGIAGFLMQCKEKRLLYVQSIFHRVNERLGLDLHPSHLIWGARPGGDVTVSGAVDDHLRPDHHGP